MNVQEHLFEVLSEECNEIGQVCSKVNRFGLLDEYQGITSKERLEKEIDDLLAVVEMLNARGLSIQIGNRENIEQKKRKVLKNMEYARLRGHLLGT